MVEQRVSKRIPFRKQIKFGTSRYHSVGYTFNLSEGGIGIKGGRLLPTKTKITANVILDGSVESFAGRVMWTSGALPGIPPSMGIKFLSPTAKLNHIYQQKK